ncbi:glycosyltransferase, partial [Pavlovales sp. CCMP2436]
GPLVYPAGFVIVFSALSGLTSGGADVARAQYIFFGFYLMTLVLALLVYRRARLAPPWALVLLTLSKRLHSIYVLRLFNDGVATLLVFAALAALTSQRWPLGCSLYSLAVSVKMNALLFAPGLFVLLCKAGGARFALQNIGLCALIQLCLGAPYLATNAHAYLSCSFDLGRVFQFKWSVNFAFLSPELFVSKKLALSLLAAHLLALLLLAELRWCRAEGGLRALLRSCAKKAGKKQPLRALGAAEVVGTMMASNFVGIVFARTLHYQFYAWYFHTLPFLLWHAPIPTAARLCLFGSIEAAWNIYPPSAINAYALLGCHLALLVGLFAGAPCVGAARRARDC